MRILLAEDEKSLSRALVVILQKNNYSVNAVDNGLDALDYASVGNYDCIVLDIMMPKLDGISVLKEIRSRRLSVPVLMLTAKSEIDDKVLGLDSGANDYLTKPFDTKELLARIRVLTRAGSSQTGSLLTFGNTRLNQSTYQLSTETGSVELSNKEYQMLEMLFMNPGNILSSELFIEHIWGLESDTETNTIWVYISNLRKKMQSIKSNVAIKAVRNMGYKVEVNND